jgi:hypothetical protein
MFECENTTTSMDAQPPTGWWWTKPTRFTLRRPVMVDPIANGADIEIPVLIVGPSAAGLTSGGRTGLGLPSW